MRMEVLVLDVARTRHGGELVMPAFRIMELRSVEKAACREKRRKRTRAMELIQAYGVVSG